ncbi:MAG: magnesium chelatase, partial [Nitrospinota bacterium]|nr:magnesium chelatase [Nitrospinota bacterium]
MVARVLSGAVLGIEGYLVEVEVNLAPGLPAFSIVGLPDAAVKESSDRVMAAIKNTNLDLPVKRITVNLAPAN